MIIEQSNHHLWIKTWGSALKGGWSQSHLSSVKGLTQQSFSPDDPGWLRPFGIKAGCACQALTAQEVCYNTTYVSTQAESEWQYFKKLTGKKKNPLVLGNSAKTATANWWRAHDPRRFQLFQINWVRHSVLLAFHSLFMGFPLGQ